MSFHKFIPNPTNRLNMLRSLRILLQLPPKTAYMNVYRPCFSGIGIPPYLLQKLLPGIHSVWVAGYQVEKFIFFQRKSNRLPSKPDLSGRMINLQVSHLKHVFCPGSNPPSALLRKRALIRASSSRMPKGLLI